MDYCGNLGGYAEYKFIWLIIISYFKASGVERGILLILIIADLIQIY